MLNHPAVQAGVVPFVAALIIAELLRRLHLSGLALLAGFAATVYLVSGFSFEPLTATRKIILLSGIATILALPLMHFKAVWIRALLTVLGGAAALWIAQRVLQQQPATTMMIWGAASALYVGWLVFWMDTLEQDSVRAASASMGIGFGTGGVAVLGASALLGQYGIALGAASGAILLLLMISKGGLTAGRALTFPLAVIAGSTGCFAVLSAQLPWYALVPLAAIPLALKLPMASRSPFWLQAVLFSTVALVCAAGAIYLTWREVGAPLV